MQELIVTEAINAVKHVFNLWASKENDTAYVILDGVESALSHHLKFVENWSRQISLRDLPRSRQLSDVFVRLRLSEKRAPDRDLTTEPRHLLTSSLHSILLGNPGAGKTTIVKHLCQHVLHEQQDEEDGDNFSFPILILLRNLQGEQSLIDHLLGLLNIRFRKDGKEDPGDPIVKEIVVAEWLNKSKTLLFLDGFDELRSQHSGRVRADILCLANLLTSAKIILTSRIGALDLAIDNSEIFYICPFDEQQIAAFTEKWLASRAEAMNFLSAVRLSPYRDTIGRPLILVNLCMVYEAYGELPEPPTLMYQKVIDLLLEYWDRQRELRRISRYGRFGPERKRQFLGALAYELAAQFSLGPKYRNAELKAAYNLICSAFSLPPHESDAVVKEIESHTGLVVKTEFDHFEFSHKSLQEYLCADHIARLPDLNPELPRLVDLPNECAIATVLSASPNGFFELMAYYFMTSAGMLYTKEHVSAFWGPYLTRLRIEGMSFTMSASLGFALLYVASLAWRNASRYPDEPNDFDLNLLDNLIKLQVSALDSIRKAIAACSVTCRTEGLVEINIGVNGLRCLPPRMPSRVVIGVEYIKSLLPSNG